MMTITETPLLTHCESCGRDSSDIRPPAYDALLASVPKPSGPPLTLYWRTILKRELAATGPDGLDGWRLELHEQQQLSDKVVMTTVCAECLYMDTDPHGDFWLPMETKALLNAGRDSARDKARPGTAVVVLAYVEPLIFGQLPGVSLGSVTYLRQGGAVMTEAYREVPELEAKAIADAARESALYERCFYYFTDANRPVE
jgi:hypothetical protein